MELYKKSDIDLVNNHINTIVDKIEVIRKETFPELYQKKEIVNISTENTTDTDKKEITIEDIQDVLDIVMDFVKRKKLKVYGGTSHNTMVVNKNKNDAFYDPNDIKSRDIDCYSTNPLHDLVEFCDLLYNKGYTDVKGSEAVHEETYKVFCKGWNALDLSYVPSSIFNNIPFTEINGIRYVHPHFAIMDMYRMYTDPINSSFRWQKTFPRLYVLQKNYPFNIIKSAIGNEYKHNINIDDGLNIIYEFIKNNKNVYLFGTYAYNILLKESGIKKKYYKQLDVQFYQIVSLSYKSDVRQLVKLLQTQLNTKDIKVIEYYPFYQFYDYNCEIVYKGEIIAKIYRYFDRCTPIHQIKYNQNNIEYFIQIGCYDYILLMEMVNAFREKILQKENYRKYHVIMISHLIEMRNYYLDKNNKTFLDKSLFQSLMTSCIGKTYDTILKAKEKRKQRKEQGKMPIFVYKPIRTIKDREFKNTSGNIVNNPQNLKIPKHNTYSYNKKTSRLKKSKKSKTNKQRKHKKKST